MLVITNHFMCYALAVVTKDQMAKTVAKVLYERFISVFGMSAKLLIDHRLNFTSALVEELCAAFGIQKCQTMAYQVECNGQVERFHQTLFRMLGKLTADKKAQWEQHLPELLQVYNWLLTTLFDVWEMPSSPSQFLLPNNECPCVLLPCLHLC